VMMSETAVTPIYEMCGCDRKEFTFIMWCEVVTERRSRPWGKAVKNASNFLKVIRIDQVFRVLGLLNICLTNQLDESLHPSFSQDMNCLC
jgi:hypothetical protein